VNLTASSILQLLRGGIAVFWFIQNKHVDLITHSAAAFVELTLEAIGEESSFVTFPNRVDS